MDDFKDFWIVIGAAGPVIALAALVQLGNSLLAIPDRTLILPSHRARQNDRAVFVAAVIAVFSAAACGIIALLATYQALANLADVYITDPKVGIKLIVLSMISLFSATLFTSIAVTIPKRLECPRNSDVL